MRSLLRLSIGLSLTLTASCLIADGTDPDALERRAPAVKVKVCHLPPGNQHSVFCNIHLKLTHTVY